MDIFAFLFMSLVVILGLGVYFLPTILAAVRKKSNITAIFVLNFLLGWSMLGWVVSLVWAVSEE
jgi:hypothetical protein